LGPHPAPEASCGRRFKTSEATPTPRTVKIRERYRSFTPVPITMVCGTRATALKTK
jgi:hypothetical protein